MDRSPGGLRVCLLLERDTALQRGLESAELLENLGTVPRRIARSMRAISSRTSPLASLGPAALTRCWRTAWARSNSLSLRTTATTSTERWRSASASQRPAVRVGPRAERRQGVMAGIGT